MNLGDLVRIYRSSDFYADVSIDELGLVVEVDPEKKWGRSLVKVVFPRITDWFPAAHLQVVS